MPSTIPGFDLHTALEQDLPREMAMVVSRTSVAPAVGDNQSGLLGVMHDDLPGALHGPLGPAI